jgi:S-adenosylmethionine decarboxylase
MHAGTEAGVEWLVDGHGCDPALLGDRAAVIALLDRIVDVMDLHVVSTAIHAFAEPGGVTALYLLTESHLTIHTFPETGVATLNAYCCRTRPPAPWAALLGELLGAREVVTTEHPRGRAAGAAP